MALTPRRSELALLGVCLIWGGTFVMVKDAVTLIGPLAFLAIRFAFAAAALLPLALAERAPVGAARGGWAPRAMAIVGTLLFAGYVLQTIGLRFTTASRAGFITGLQVVLVPLAVWALRRRRPSPRTWLAAILSVVGLGLLAQPGATGAALPRQILGDMLVLGCAAAFALHIVAIGAFASGTPPLRLALGQIVVAGSLAAVGAASFETLVWPIPTPVLAAAAFTGVLATAVAFGIQTTAQRHVTPERTGLIFATEPVFAGLFGMALAGDVLRAPGWAGAALVVVAMALGGSGRPTAAPRPAEPMEGLV